jgi:hypothetical protein
LRVEIMERAKIASIAAKAITPPKIRKPVPKSMNVRKNP